MTSADRIGFSFKGLDGVTAGSKFKVQAYGRSRVKGQGSRVKGRESRVGEPSENENFV